MDLLKSLKRLPWLWLQAGVYIFYLVTHFIGLTALPVFADEAIYIRWSQLIIDDWQRYLFFPLNDGKTPIFVWLMVPFLKVFQDQLLAGRVLSVLVGLAQVFVIGRVIKSLGGSRGAQFIGMLLTTILPFWFFYHRIALMDGLMTLFISISLWILIKLALHLELKKSLPHTVIFTVTAGIAFGLAILSKVPALFFGPGFVFIALFPLNKHQFKLLLPKIFWIGAAGAVGIALFLLLKLNPAFGQLFLRGQNFTYSTSELLAGDWMNSLRNVPRFFGWLLFYLTPGVIFFSFLGLLSSTLRKRTLFLLVLAALFCGPFIVFGKTVYPRYLLPASIFFTVSASLVIDKLLKIQNKVRYVTIGLLGFVTLWSVYSMLMSLFNVSQVPYVIIDIEQYRAEWSAGYGVKEASDFIIEQAKQGKVVVATEGYFGTLPDGILLYLHNQDVSNIEVFGIGEPVRGMPKDFVAKAGQAKFAYVMVNSHRMKSSDTRLHKIMSYPRPFGAPSFDIYEFKLEQ